MFSLSYYCFMINMSCMWCNAVCTITIKTSKSLIQQNCLSKFFYLIIIPCSISLMGHRGPDRMIVGFATTYAISAYHHWCCEFESWSRRGVQHYVIIYLIIIPCSISLIFTIIWVKQTLVHFQYISFWVNCKYMYKQIKASHLSHF
jgi:hypothetical protein